MTEAEVLKIIKKAEKDGHTKLDLSGKKLKSLPEEIGNLTKLTELYLSSNQLTSLPPSIAELKNLQGLYLSYNQLTSIPPSIAELKNLQELDLSSNQLTSLPPSIAELKNLQGLYLSSNQLTSLPPSIAELKNLQGLYLSSNRLTSLPPSIAELKNMQGLYLGFNQLTSLPPSIAELKNLQRLYLSSNQLTSLPPSIAELKNLEDLNLDNNLDLREPPPEVATKGLQDIRDYFRQIKEGMDHLCEAKLLIVGEAGAGKTSLARKIENPEYQLRDEYTTKGIDVIRWEFPMEDGKSFRVNIWDFGGQEIYHATHQFFLTKRSLYALVADTRSENTDFYYWLNVVELLSDNSPMVIIKNEKQNRKRQIDESGLRGQFRNLKETLACNLADNRGLPDVLKKIRLNISNLPHVGTKLPKTWVDVRKELEDSPHDYISLDEYLNICERNGFTRESDKLQLSGYLHDLGVCLHFQEDPLLKKTVILKTEWGTDAVYKVLDNEKVIDNMGRFSRDDLDDIWDEQKYTGMQDELLQLMINFRLCYRIPGTEHTYIAPQLLTVNRPSYQWDEANNLIVRYKYEFMPKGIITRLIVAMHADILIQEYVWRSGVILERDETQAEVIEYYDKREMRIRVAGKNKKQLMTIVTYELDKIHSSFHRLKCSKLIPCNCAACKGSQNPHFYDYNVLRKFLSHGQTEIQCQSTYEMVDVRRLIDDVHPIVPADEKNGFEGAAGPVIHETRFIKEYHQYENDQQGNEKPKGKKKWYRTIWAAIVGAMILLAAIVTILTGITGKPVTDYFKNPLNDPSDEQNRGAHRLVAVSFNNWLEDYDRTLMPEYERLLADATRRGMLRSGPTVKASIEYFEEFRRKRDNMIDSFLVAYSVAGGDTLDLEFQRKLPVNVYNIVKSLVGDPRGSLRQYRLDTL